MVALSGLVSPCGCSAAAAGPSHSQGANGPRLDANPFEGHPAATRTAAMASDSLATCLRARSAARRRCRSPSLSWRRRARHKCFRAVLHRLLMLRLGRISDPYKPAWRAAPWPSRRSEPAARLRHFRRVLVTRSQIPAGLCTGESGSVLEISSRLDQQATGKSAESPNPSDALNHIRGYRPIRFRKKARD
jgi:hypothetical protein